MDNRPLKYDEFEAMINQCLFVSATPGKIELEKTGGEVISAAFVIDLPDLGGADKLRAKGVKVHTLVGYGGH